MVTNKLVKNTTNNTTIVWLRNDLRLRDNRALTAACERGDIIPIYIFEPKSLQQLGGASKWWLHHSLNQLQQSFGGKLLIFVGKPLDILSQLIESTKANAVYWNRRYLPEEIETDIDVKATLSEQQVAVKSFNASLLWEPWQITKQDNTPYKVFTPFYTKGALPKSPAFPLPAPPQMTFGDVPVTSVQLDDIGLLPTIDWDQDFYHHWQPGEAGASQQLALFLDDAVNQYKKDRDVPSLPGTSKLSPHLHFGEISPNQIWYSVKQAPLPESSSADIATYLKELGWREFSYYLLFHFPHMLNENFNAKFNHFKWQHNPEFLTAWQQGKTGIPIVDAGMRELWQTGYMHNRVRMIVASFLTKNLLIDWRYGLQWFHDCLVDADQASNCASWQWVAGSGADAAPYFRIFNPVLQGEKFDKMGEYVSRYCPELAKLPPKYIHKPWQAPEDVLQLAQITLGDTYPHPLVDLKTSREQALSRYAQIKS
ncbi:cryptochrome/photolyase family protein [Thalassotalea agarivorans]|uniref:Deoxyribodipyrimidine photo-lyase n=1 Tax=Thalassotalea agarivorans TaxID=349064 RepID=A0A1H9ZKD4_THASX|nr:deoxyribodipyrimidine photo-lyase [Thalassotalea agarivorans]SES82063.1 deoxyribodipyrimidine photo-lyase [Thalassotalea agarivorans]